MSTDAGTDSAVEWKPTACILCECNCGILVRLGGDNGRHFEQIRGDKAHPASSGLLRLDDRSTRRFRAPS
jgi:anaerobic selenocysteine-containing dehydrogenase